MPPRDRRIRLHIQNDPLSPNDAVTPPRFASGARGAPELRRRLRVTFGVDPPALEEGLREAEILVAAHVDGRNLATRAPHLRWIQSTSAGVEKLVSLLPPDVVLTNASGVHIPKGGEYAMTALLMLNHGVPHFVTRQRERRWDPDLHDPDRRPHGGHRRGRPDRRRGGAPRAALRHEGPGRTPERPAAPVGSPDVHHEGAAHGAPPGRLRRRHDSAHRRHARPHRREGARLPAAACRPREPRAGPRDRLRRHVREALDPGAVGRGARRVPRGAPSARSLPSGPRPTSS